MNTTRLSVSLSPHVSHKDSVQKIMYTVVIALIPAFLVSVYFFGIEAIRVQAIAVAACIFFEWAMQKFLIKGDNTIPDGSAILTGILLAFNVPANLPWHIIVIGALVAIGIGKMSFGGLGKNPFNPALVGRVFLLISFPVQMTSWPKVQVMNFAMTDAETGATPLAMLKEGVSNGEPVSKVLESMPTSYSDWMIGEMGGSLGEISALALILGGIYMLWKKVIKYHIPLAVFGSIALFTGILNLVNPEVFAGPGFHLLTGGVMLGAIYMATDMVTSPMTTRGMWIYGIGIGVITVLIRVWGAYPEGISFAILIMNAFVPLINRQMKPKLFGEKKDNK
ncbi:MAG: RnfABCDGE type electron transport complex subunit D [Bacteroidota bacterium]